MPFTNLSPFCQPYNFLSALCGGASRVQRGGISRNSGFRGEVEYMKCNMTSYRICIRYCFYTVVVKFQTIMHWTHVYKFYPVTPLFPSSYEYYQTPHHQLHSKNQKEITITSRPSQSLIAGRSALALRWRHLLLNFRCGLSWVFTIQRPAKVYWGLSCSLINANNSEQYYLQWDDSSSLQ